MARKNSLRLARFCAIPAMLFLLAVGASGQVAVGITLIPQTLPSATVNVPYLTALTSDTTGGAPPYTYSAAQLPQGLSMNSAGLITGTPTTVESSFTGSVTITDSSNPAQSVTLALYIQVFPQPLTITTMSLPLGIQGAPYSQQIQAAGGVAPYSWSIFRGSLTNTGLALDPHTGILSGTPASSGSLSFTVQVADSELQQSTGFQKLTLQVDPQLVISTSAALRGGVVGSAYSFQLTTQAGTGGSNVITWSAAGVLPPGLILDATGLLHGTPTTAGTFSFPVTASDGYSPARLNATLSIYGPLSITTTQLPNASLQQAYGPVTIATSGGSGSFNWIASGLPAGLTFSAGVISGTPTAGGTFTVTVGLVDLVLNQLISQNFTLTVAYPGFTITPPATIGIALGGSVSVTLAATGGLTPYTWAPAAALPQGFTLTQAGVLSGTPSQAGNIALSVQVTDAEPATVSATVNVNVLGLTTASPLPAGNTVSTYSATFSALGGTQPYSFSATGLPSGLSLSSAGVLKGTVTQPQTYSFAVQVKDSTGIVASSTYTLQIAVPGPLSLTAPTLSNGTVNVAYSDSLDAAASGGSPPYNWSVESGALPPGISLSTTGILSGTPSAADMYAFKVDATDGAGATTSVSVTLQVNPPALTITTQSPLSSGVVNANYPQQILTASGGVSPYTFSITGGSLPGGLTLNDGVIGGKPSTAGPSSVTITVTDYAGSQATATLTINIRPASTDLELSAGSLSFSLSTGSSAVPPAQIVLISSTDSSQVLDFSAQLDLGAYWLSYSVGTATPSQLTISLNNAALTLPASGSPYVSTITLTCNSTPCKGNTQILTVTAVVTAAPAVLNAVTELLSFSTSSSPPAASSQPLTIQNAGGGSLSLTSVSCEASWCSVGGYPASLGGGVSAAITITGDPTGLAPGYYRTQVDIASSSGPASIPVTLLIAQASEILLAPAGEQVEMSAGGSPGSTNGSFLVSVAGNGVLSWTAAVLSGAPWVILNTPNGMASSAAPGTVSFSIDPAVVAGLSAQAYYATIEITAPNALNSPLDFQLVLDVTPATNPLNWDPEPAGLVFIAPPGSAPPPQTVQVLSSSATSVGYQVSAATNDGAPWLSVSPGTGSTSTPVPGQSEVSVDTSNLAPGVYYGGVSYSVSAVRTVNVTLIVEAPVAGPSASAAPGSVHGNATAPPACAPSALAPAQTGLVNNFSAPASWPTPLAILLLNDCGNAVPNGQVVVNFTNGDPPLALPLANGSTGLYSGTWTPRNTGSQVSLNAHATAPGFAPASLQITGAVVPNTAPVLATKGTLHGFNPQLGAALAPGTIVQIYGSGLASGNAAATTIPLPISLNGTSVIIGGVPAPLYFISPGQINAQIPYELNPNNQYQVIANANGALSTPNTIQLAPVTPGFAAYPDGTLIAQHLDNSLVTETNPAQPGEYIVAYMAGLGDTTVPVTTGDASPVTPLAYASVAPVLTLNGNISPQSFAGLTPGLVGLYQLDFQVPANAPNGDMTVVITQGTFASNSTIMPVQAPSQ